MEQNLHEQLLSAALQAGLTVIGLDLASKILAVVYKYDDERIVYSDKLRADCAYIQKRYGVEGACIPDAELVQLVKMRIAELPDRRADAPAWALELFQKRYGIMLNQHS